MTAKIIGLIVLGLLSACATVPTAPSTFSDVPLPHDAAVKPPGPNVPANLAKFSGAWRGVWKSKTSDVTEHGIMVLEETLPPNKASILEAWGPTDTIQAGWARTMVTIKGNKLTWRPNNSVVDVYTLMPDGTLHGTSKKAGPNGFDDVVVMTRCGTPTECRGVYSETASK